MTKLADLDIKDGDYLFVENDEYAIRSANRYPYHRSRRPSPSMQAAMRVDARTERRQTAKEIVKITPVLPASSEVYATNVMQAPLNLYETMVMAEDGFIRLVLEAVKR